MLCRFLDGSLFQGLQALALLFVLFGPDIVAMKSVSNSIDPIIDGLLIVSMVLFTLDLAVCFLCRPKLSMLEVNPAAILHAAGSEALLTCCAAVRIELPTFASRGQWLCSVNRCCPAWKV